MRNLRERNGAVLSPAEIIFIALSPFIALIICDLFNIYDNETVIRMLMKAALALVAVYGVVEARRGRMDYEKILKLLIISGIVMRVGYMIYTPWGTYIGGRGYDEGSIRAYGHYSYLVNWAMKLKLPDSNKEQFYQPPLNYFLSAVMLKIGGLINHTAEYSSDGVMKYAEVVPCMAACVMLPAIQRIFSELKIEYKYQIPAVAIMVFFPNYLFLGGRINNDSLVAMFMVLSVLFTIRWYNKPNIKDIIYLALSIGLGMMSKISCGTIALFTGPVMLYVLYKSYKEGRAVEIIKQLAVFAAICFPLGLWYPIRNYILFDQPINYVQRLRETDAVYSGDTPWYDRFFSMPIWEELKKGIKYSNDDTSIPMMVTKSAVIGAFNFDHIPKIVKIVLYLANLALIILSLASMAAVSLYDKARDAFSRYSMLFLWVVIFGSFIMFNISYPYICTADVRYIPLTMVIGAAYISMAYRMYDEQGRFGRIIRASGVLIAIFCITAAVMNV